MNTPTTYDLTRPRTPTEEYLLRIAKALEGIEKALWAIKKDTGAFPRG